MLNTKVNPEHIYPVIAAFFMSFLIFSGAYFSTKTYSVKLFFSIVVDWFSVRTELSHRFVDDS